MWSFFTLIWWCAILLMAIFGSIVRWGPKVRPPGDELEENAENVALVVVVISIVMAVAWFIARFGA